MRDRRKAFVGVVGVALALSASPSRAVEPCAADAERLCAGVPRGAGRLFFCLKSNSADLSDDCKDLVNWAERQAYDAGLDCQGDIFAWCQGVPAGQGRVFSCLMSHRDSISSQCQEALARVSAFTEACGGDAARLCPGIPATQGAVLVCLITQRNELSPSCRAIFWP